VTDTRACSKCGAAVVDAYRHEQWHSHHDDATTSLQRALRDLETSTKRTLQAFEAMLRRPG